MGSWVVLFVRTGFEEKVANILKSKLDRIIHTFLAHEGRTAEERWCLAKHYKTSILGLRVQLHLN